MKGEGEGEGECEGDCEGECTLVMSMSCFQCRSRIEGARRSATQGNARLKFLREVSRPS